MNDPHPESSASSDAAAQKFEAEIRRQEARTDLFLEKVNVVGQLHVERATLANKLGELKTQAMIQRSRGDSNPRFEALIVRMEEKLSSISADITAHVPPDIAALHAFRDEVRDRLAEVAELYRQAYASEEDNVSGDLDLSNGPHGSSPGDR